MKKHITKDEAYPVYDLVDGFRIEVDLTDEEIQWYEKVSDEYDNLQNFLREKYDVKCREEIMQRNEEHFQKHHGKQKKG